MLGIRPEHTLFGGRRTSTSSRASRSSLNAKYDRLLGSSHSLRTGKGSLETIKQVEQEKRRLDEGRQKKREEEEQALFNKLGIVAPNGLGSRASRNSTEVIADLQKYRLGNVKQSKTAKLSEELERILYPKPRGVDALPKYPPDPPRRVPVPQAQSPQPSSYDAHPPWLQPHAGHPPMPFMSYPMQPPGYWSQTHAGWAFYPAFPPWMFNTAPPESASMNGPCGHAPAMPMLPLSPYGPPVDGASTSPPHQRDITQPPLPKGILKASSDVAPSSDPPSPSSRQVRFRDTPDFAPSQQNGRDAELEVQADDERHDTAWSRPRTGHTSGRSNQASAGIPQSLKQAHSRLLIPDGAPPHNGKPSARVLVRELERMAEQMSFLPRYSTEGTDEQADRSEYNQYDQAGRLPQIPGGGNAASQIGRPGQIRQPAPRGEFNHDQAPDSDGDSETSDEETGRPNGYDHLGSPEMYNEDQDRDAEDTGYRSPVKRQRCDTWPSQNPLRQDNFYPTASFGSIHLSQAQSATSDQAPSPDVLDSTFDLRNGHDESYHSDPSPDHEDDNDNSIHRHTAPDHYQPYYSSQRVVQDEEEAMASVESSLSGQDPDPDHFEAYRPSSPEPVPAPVTVRKRHRFGDLDDSADLSYHPSSTPEPDELEYEDNVPPSSLTSSPPEPKRIRLNEGIWSRFEVPADKLAPPAPVKAKRRAKLQPQQQPQPRIKVEPPSQISHIETPYEEDDGEEERYGHDYEFEDANEDIEGSWSQSQSDRSHHHPFGLSTIPEDDEEQEEEEDWRQQGIATDLADFASVPQEGWAGKASEGDPGFRVWRDEY